MRERIERHRRACAGFGAVVGRVGEAWSAPSPCDGWDARAVLEHVIGFHEVLVLRPLGVRAHRPKDDPVGRWVATETAIFAALDDAPAGDRIRGVPGAGAYDLAALLPALTTDVLVHTWDLARAAHLEVQLDRELCERALASAPPQHSDFFAPSRPVPLGADVQTRMIAAYGRKA